MIVKLVSTLLAAFSLGGCAALLNSDRPRFSGPVVKPLWSIPGLAIDTTPVIHDGIVYVKCTESGKASLHAIDLASGKPLWQTPFATADLLGFINPRLFVTDDQGQLHSLDARTGKEIAPPEKTPVLGMASSGNMLYLTFTNRSVVALDRPGHHLWESSAPLDILMPPLLAGNTLYIYGKAKDGCAIHAFDPSNGTVRWKWESRDCSGLEETPMTALTVESDAVFFRVDSTTVDDHAGKIIALDPATGQEKWNTRTVNFQNGAPLVFDASTIVVSDNIPGDHGGTAFRKNPYILRGLDRSTGAIKWESRTSWKYEAWTHRDGLLFVADRQAHALINTFNESSPDSFLTVVDIRTAKELWRSEMVQLGTFTVPAVGNGIVVVGSMPFGDPKGAGLYAFRATRNGQ